MPCIIQLGRQPYLFSWDSGIFDPLPHFVLIPICQRGIDMPVALFQGDLDGIPNFIGFALPGAKADGWDLVAGVESKGFAVWIQD